LAAGSSVGRGGAAASAGRVSDGVLVNVSPAQTIVTIRAKQIMDARFLVLIS
jgi:hypothetical protein